jgi:hypothetical protein
MAVAHGDGANPRTRRLVDRDLHGAMRSDKAEAVVA